MKNSTTKTFLNRTFIVVMSPLLIISIIIRKSWGALVEIKDETISSFSDLWAHAARKPRTLEEKKQDLINKLHRN